MQNISGLSINLDVEYVKGCKTYLNCFFDFYSNKLEREKSKTEASIFIAPQANTCVFDRYGALWIKLIDLDKKSLELINVIEQSYLALPFFGTRKGSIGTRGLAYYASSIIDDEYRKSLRLLSLTSITCDLLYRYYSDLENRWEFGIYALLDDLRYKLILLQEANSANAQQIQPQITVVVNTFYDYLQGIITPSKKVLPALEQLQAILASYPCQVASFNAWRTYKEADHPYQNLMFREKILQMRNGQGFDTIIGLRFGGSELPFIIQRYFPNSKLLLCKISNYSDGQTDIQICKDLVEKKSILILDDNILTGRTLNKIIYELNTHNPKGIFFGCISYSDNKRYHQMLMKGHGVINPSVLLYSCLLQESPYTRITNNKSYKNANGVFDKIKSGLQVRMKNDYMGIKL